MKINLGLVNRRKRKLSRNDRKDYESKEYEMTKYLETKKNSLEDVSSDKGKES